MTSFQGKVVVVTGGTSGIGEALAQELARRGAKVVVSGRREEVGRQVVEAITNAGGQALFFPADVTRAPEVEALVSAAVDTWGRVDGLFNCAGVVTVGEVRDMDLAAWEAIFSVNVLGVVHGISAVYPRLIAQGSGFIVNVASLAGLLPEPTCAAYSASKWAVVGLSVALRAEAAGLGVRVCVACPAFVETPIFQSAALLKISRHAVFGDIPRWAIQDAPSAALQILAGVERDEGLIVFPRYARLAWGVWRLHPALLSPVLRRMVARFRQHRQG